MTNDRKLAQFAGAAVSSSHHVQNVRKDNVSTVYICLPRGGAAALWPVGFPSQQRWSAQFRQLIAGIAAMPAKPSPAWLPKSAVLGPTDQGSDPPIPAGCVQSRSTQASAMGAPARGPPVDHADVPHASIRLHVWAGLAICRRPPSAAAQQVQPAGRNRRPPTVQPRSPPGPMHQIVR